MGKIWGTILLAAALGLTACAGPSTSGSAPEPSATASETASQTAKIAPLFASAATTAAASPSASASLPSEFYDDSARGKYLAGVKKALNAWRNGVIPSDEELLKGAEVSCGYLAEGKTWADIGAMAGPDEIAMDNASAVASYASRFLCTKYNTFH